MRNVDLIFDADCPNVEAARAQLLQAFEAVQLAPRWQEWIRGAVGNPPHVDEYGSPTILVDGHDVAAGTVADGATCRLYTDEAGGLQSVPPLQSILSALGAYQPGRLQGLVEPRPR